MHRWVAGLIALLVLTGCGRRQPSPVEKSSSRIICATPAVAEIVFALGCGDRVVGVSAFTDWPPEAADIPEIGGALTPSCERILMLEPTLILSQGQAEMLGTWARARGIGFVTVPLDTLVDLRKAVSRFAEVLEAEAAGTNLLEAMEEQVWDSVSGSADPVFLAIGHAPGDLSSLMTSGSGTFLDELVALAGGRNIFADVRVPWPSISQESMIRRNPRLILDFQSFPMQGSRRDALLADWDKLRFQTDQVRFLDEAVFLRPGPRAVQSLPLLAEAIQGNGQDDSPE